MLTALAQVTPFLKPHELAFGVDGTSPSHNQYTQLSRSGVRVMRRQHHGQHMIHTNEQSQMHIISSQKSVLDHHMATCQSMWYKLNGLGALYQLCN